MEILFFVFLIIAGFVGGFLSGLLGIGGGLVFVPVLISVGQFGLIKSLETIQVVIATSLFTTILTSSASLYQHKKNNNVSFKTAIPLLIGATISALIIPLIMSKLNHELLIKILAIVLILVALYLIFLDEKIKKVGKSKPILQILLGIIFGGIAIVSGLGGGIFYGPILYFFTQLDFKKSVGTSSLIILVTISISMLQFITTNQTFDEPYQIGYVNFLTSILLGIGALFGPKVGIHFLNKSSNRLIKIIFSLFLIMYSLKLLILS